MTREQKLQLALDLALCYLVKHEPGDSRAVSDEFVAMASIACDQPNQDVAVAIIQKALSVERERPKEEPQIPS